MLPTNPTAVSTFIPIRARSDGRYLCEYDPERHLLRFRRGEWEETVDLTEHVPAGRLAAGYAALLLKVLEMVNGAAP